MYFIELRFTNGKILRLPEPYILWMEAHREVISKYSCKSQYTASIVHD